MSKHSRTIEDAVRRLVNFFDHEKIDVNSVHLLLVYCNLSGDGKPQANISIPLHDVREAHIEIKDSSVAKGDRREIETMLYRFMTED